MPEVSKAEENVREPVGASEGVSIARKETTADKAQSARTEDTSVSQKEQTEAGKTEDKTTTASQNTTTSSPEGEKSSAEGEAQKADSEKENGTKTADKTEKKPDDAKAEAKAAEADDGGKSGSTAAANDNGTKQQEGTPADEPVKTDAAEGAAKEKTGSKDKEDPPKEAAETPTEKSAEADKPEEKPEKPNIVLSVLGIILCVVLVPILALNIVLIVQGFTQDASVMPNIAGKFPLMVQSGSMSPTIEVGDLIIVNAPEKGQTFGVDDVVTFWDGAPGSALVTHRIVEITTDDDGKTAYRTKGDANSAQDGTLVYPEDIVGTYVMRIPYLGDVAMFMQTIPGLIVCVILPLALFIVYDVIRRRKLSKSEQEETAALMEELERLRAEQGKK